MPGPSLGTNLGAIVDWSTAFPFLDLFKQSRHWFTQRDGAFNTGQDDLLNLDSEGWVKSFTKDGSSAPFQRVCTVWNTAGQYTKDGLYVIDWKGEGQLEVVGGQIVSQTGNKIILDPGDGTIGINITTTDPNLTGNYIRDIRIYHQDDTARLNAGEVFNPAFLEKIQDFRVLRFMDWMDTNNSDIRTWAQAPNMDAAQQSANTGHGGASIDMMVALANKVKADPWFTIPHGADANYIRQLATFVRDHLDPDLKARFEYSNEVWNWMFEQAQWAEQQGKAAWGANTEGAWMQWYGVKAAEMANIVADVFGAETGTRALNVFSTQGGWHGLENYALEAPAHVARGGTAPKDAPFHVYTIAPHFGYGLSTEGMRSQVNTWISQGEAGFKAALAWLGRDASGMASTVAYHAAVAMREGWQLEAYEGGQHVVDYSGNAAFTNFFTALVDRPEMAEIYNQYFNMWKSNGGGLMAHFSDFGAGDQYGSWGIWDSAYSGNTSRADAVEMFRDTVDAWWADSRPESVFSGDTETGTPSATPISDGGIACTLVGTSGDDIFLVSQSETVVQAGTGNDVVRSSASWTMSAGVEALLLTGTSSIYGIGTVAADIIGGNDAANILTGLGGNDTLSGSGGNDTLQGGDGSDRLLGGAGTDTLEGGANTDTLEGGGDNDIYILTDAGDAIVEGLDGGTADRVMTGWSSTLAVNVEQLQLTGTAAVNGTGNDSDNTMVGNGAGNILTGLAGNDTIDGLGGSDLVRAGAGNDVVRSGEGTDRIAMDLGDDLIDGGGTYLDELFFEGTAAMTIDLTKTTAQVTGLGTDTIRNIENVSGGGGNDRITGNDRWNLLQGGAGNDRLYGGTGRDRLEGGSGRDEMLGGSDQDRDVFVFTSVQESAVGTARDAIRQFTRSIDDIDLSAIDANSNMSGNQAFAFSGSTARAYGVWTSALDGNQVVRADVDGDRVADMEIRVDGWARLTASDFVL